MYSSWMKKYDEIVEKEDTKVSELDREELEATREITTGKKIVNKLVDMAESDEQRMVGGRTQGKTIELSMKLREEILKLPKCKMYGIMRCKKEGILLNKEEVIPKRIIEVKLAEINESIEEESKKCKKCKKTDSIDNLKMLSYGQELLEELLKEV